MKDIIICPHCKTVNKKRKLYKNEIAVCSVCKKTLYKAVDEKKLFVFSFSLFIFFVVTLFLPIVKIDIIGFEENLNLVKSFFFLYSKGYIFISLFMLFSVILFPFICFFSVLLLSIFFLTKKKRLSKSLLIVITILNDWCFFDIFFIAILVSLIKIVSYGSIEIKEGFFSFILFLIFAFYIFKFIGVHSLWEKWENL